MDIQNIENYIDNIEVTYGITKDDIIVHHRCNNNKRDYLFVNRLQAKHIPSRPSSVIHMSYRLKRLIDTTSYNKITVIAFAETATAIGNFVAEALETLDKKIYILQTTRENISSERLVDFEEEHSHAVNQSLLISKEMLENEPEILNADCYVLVDDEITTGKTVINLVSKLRNKIKNNKADFIVASICNWQNEDDKKAFKNENIKAVSLMSGVIKDKQIKMSSLVPNFDSILCHTGNVKRELTSECRGHHIGINLITYNRESLLMSERTGHKVTKLNELSVKELLDKINPIRKKYDKIRVIGTEEFMTIPIKLANIFEEEFDCEAYVQATTRSNIDIMLDGKGLKNYITLPSIYDSDRETYLYNIDNDQDIVVVISDRPSTKCFEEELLKAFNYIGMDLNNIYFVTLY